MAPPRSVPLSGCLSFLLLPLIFLCVDGSDVRVHISGLPSSSVTTSPSALSLPVTAAPLASNENGDATRPLLTLTLRLQPSVQHESYLRLHLPHTGQTRRVDSADNARCAFYAGTARLKHTYAQTLALQLPRRPPRTKTDAGANAGPNSAGPDPTPDVLQSATVTLALCNGEVRAVMYLDAVQGAALVLLPLSETGSHTLRLEVPPQVMTEAESTAPLSGPSLRLRQPATAGASSLPLPSVSVPRASTCGAVHPRRGPLAAGAVASRSRIRRASSLECASRPTKTVSLVVVSDAKHLAQHGGDGAAAALDALAAVHATQSLLADAAFDCSIALRVVGHVVFESAADLRLPVRACNTVDPLFANALPMSDPCCAWLESNGPTPTPTGCGTKVYCLADAGGQEATTAACFTKSIAYGTLEDSSGTLVLEAEQFSITGVTSTRADEVEGFGLLSYLSEQATAVPAASDTLRTLFSEHGVDVDHFLLLSGGDFAGSLRGLAYVGGMCGGGQSSSINMADLGTLAAATVATMAHELGHSLGMVRRLEGGISDWFCQFCFVVFLSFPSIVLSFVSIGISVCPCLSLVVRTPRLPASPWFFLWLSHFIYALASFSLPWRYCLPSNSSLLPFSFVFVILSLFLRPPVLIFCSPFLVFMLSFACITSFRCVSLSCHIPSSFHLIPFLPHHLSHPRSFSLADTLPIPFSLTYCYLLLSSTLFSNIKRYTTRIAAPRRTVRTLWRRTWSRPRRSSGHRLLSVRYTPGWTTHTPADSVSKTRRLPMRSKPCAATVSLS